MANTESKDADIVEEVEEAESTLLAKKKYSQTLKVLFVLMATISIFLLLLFYVLWRSDSGDDSHLMSNYKNPGITNNQAQETSVNTPVDEQLERNEIKKAVKKFGLPYEIYKAENIEDLKWLKTLSDDHSKLWYYGLMLSKVLQKNSFPHNKGMIAKICLKKVLRYRKRNRIFSFWIKSLLNIMIEQENYAGIAEILFEQKDPNPLARFLGETFLPRDYRKFIQLFRDKSDRLKLAILLYKVKNGKKIHTPWINFKTSTFANLNILGYYEDTPTEILANKSLMNLSVLYIIFNADREELLTKLTLTKVKNYIKSRFNLRNRFIMKILLLLNIASASLEENSIPTLVRNGIRLIIADDKIREELYKYFVVASSYGKDLIVSELVKLLPKDLKSFVIKSVRLLRNYDLKYVIKPFLDVCQLYKSDNSGEFDLNSQVINDFLFSNFKVSKVNIIKGDLNALKIETTFELSSDEGVKEFKLTRIFVLKDGSKLEIAETALEYYCIAVFKDSNVLEEFLSMLEPAEDGHQMEQPATLETLIMIADSETIRERIKELNVKFSGVQSYDKIKYDYIIKVIPYELVTHPNAKNLHGIYTAPDVTNYPLELMQLDEDNPEHFDNFKLLTGKSIQEYVTSKFSDDQFDIFSYVCCKNTFEYWRNNGNAAELEKLYEFIEKVDDSSK